MNVSIKEAKQHWKTHTRKVLTNCALKDARELMNWDLDADNNPIVILGNIGFYRIRFLRNSNGHIYGEQFR